MGWKLYIGGISCLCIESKWEGNPEVCLDMPEKNYTILLNYILMDNRDKNKTEFARVHELLLKEGFHEITEKEKKEEWYKVGIAPISCETETEEEFERLCNKNKRPRNLGNVID